MIAANLLWLALSAVVFELPLTGGPPTVVTLAISEVGRLPGVERADTDGRTLRLEVAAGQEVRLRDIDRALSVQRTAIAVDRRRLPVTSRTIFEINAGQCFYCSEKPLGQTLSRTRFVKSWTVVDYATKGRLRFRVEPRQSLQSLKSKTPVFLEELAPDSIEDVLFTARYDAAPPIDLYWPTGGVAWRRTEAVARREATASKKPLMIFPTAGT